MKILCLTLLLLVALCTGVVAQQTGNNILTAKAAQVLALMPANDKQGLDNAMDQL